MGSWRLSGKLPINFATYRIYNLSPEAFLAPEATSNTILVKQL